MNNELRATASPQPALVASDQAASRLAPPGFDQAHGPETCKRCGGSNPPWSAPSPLWNAIMRDGSINGEPLFEDMVCAVCFMEIAEEKGAAFGWRIEATDVRVELETITPSGRVWDTVRWLWTEPHAGVDRYGSSTPIGS